MATGAAALVEARLEHGAVAVFLALAFSSCRSATSRIISRSCSRFCRFFADTLTKTVVPPHSSGMSPRSESCCFTRSGWASGLSILLTATMMGTPAAFAWSMASRVWGMTPSSAATTRMTTSVTLAPRARIRVKASWPGVSRKTTLRLPTSTWYAPMCWVMPPASPAATVVSRMASRSEVLPWSTWPMTVTTGARAVRSSGFDSEIWTCSTSSSKDWIPAS